MALRLPQGHIAISCMFGGDTVILEVRTALAPLFPPLHIHLMRTHAATPRY